MKNVRLSLEEIAGKEYVESVCTASALLGLGKKEELLAIAAEKVDFFPAEYQERLDSLIEKAGTLFSAPLAKSCNGAASAAFTQALHRESAPLSGMGFFRIGEDGRLAIIGKSEHYQASCGHNFPGYKLLINAMRMGITNMTHNNTRGHITRLLERELVRLGNGIARGDEKKLDEVIASNAPHVLNRVINLETGSLACEAACKMMLARFYKLQPHLPAPKYAGKIPVFLVMSDFKGGKEANYHGTTIFTQMLRGMWHEFYNGCEEKALFKAVPVKINDREDFAKAVAEYEKGDYKVAGFIHELVLMNYGGIRLNNDYVTSCHKICDEHDIPVFVDEIQSCMWSKELFLFREYECRPDFVSVGKGFPGGMYPASRILTTSQMDNLNLFGALVTNGQEELASLANLITIRFAEENAFHTEELGKKWQSLMNALAAKYPSFIVRAEGDGLLSALFFHTAEETVAFCKKINHDYCIDISAQTYKADCPPAALAKLPLISSFKLLDFVSEKMDLVLAEMEKEKKA